MESPFFQMQMRDRTVKGRIYTNGSTHHKYSDQDEAASPTAMTESIIITGVIAA
jgi:hypothetical protein